MRYLINLIIHVRKLARLSRIIFSLDQVISYDSSRGGVSVVTERGDVTTSRLLVQNADLPDSGKYSCEPSNAEVASIRVHVLNGKSFVEEFTGKLCQITSNIMQNNFMFFRVNVIYYFSV